jgi:hypothetical protein
MDVMSRAGNALAARERCLFWLKIVTFLKHFLKPTFFVSRGCATDGAACSAPVWPRPAVSRPTRARHVRIRAARALIVSWKRKSSLVRSGSPAPIVPRRRHGRGARGRRRRHRVSVRERGTASAVAGRGSSPRGRPFVVPLSRMERGHSAAARAINRRRLDWLRVCAPADNGWPGGGPAGDRSVAAATVSGPLAGWRGGTAATR